MYRGYTALTLLLLIAAVYAQLYDALLQRYARCSSCARPGRPLRQAAEFDTQVIQPAVFGNDINGHGDIDQQNQAVVVESGALKLKHKEKPPLQQKKSIQKKKLNYFNDDITTKRAKCCPYNYDPSHCRLVDDRVLCGFNHNVGRPISQYLFEDLSNGCRLRGGRLECGYNHGPYTNPRRPPPWNHDGEHDGSLNAPAKLQDNNPPVWTQPPAPVTKPFTINEQQCHEKDGRIVCKVL